MAYHIIQTDEYQAFTTPVAAATTFLLALASNRTKSTFLPILVYINNVVGQRGPPEQRFGALNMMAALGKQIMQHPQASKSVERFLLEFVSPELEGSNPYLVAIVSKDFDMINSNDHEFGLSVGPRNCGYSHKTRLPVVFRRVVGESFPSSLSIIGP
jgi:hypothetical protein